AEDGIRAFHVTGVQTCALPIWPSVPEEVSKGVLGHGHHLHSVRWTHRFGPRPVVSRPRAVTRSPTGRRAWAVTWPPTSCRPPAGPMPATDGADTLGPALFR